MLLLTSTFSQIVPKASLQDPSSILDVVQVFDGLTHAAQELSSRLAYFFSFIFTHFLSIKLNEKNYLLWNQQVKSVITAHESHCMVANPSIPQKNASKNDYGIKCFSHGSYLHYLKRYFLESLVANTHGKCGRKYINTCNRTYKPR